MSSVEITIHYTTDVHGRAQPVDPITGAPFAGGLSRAATLLQSLRESRPEAIYLDLGDLVQGSPMSYLHIHDHPEKPHPMLQALHEMGCAGMVVGNHEFNFGLDWLNHLKRQAEFPVLAANVIGPDGEPFFEPVLWIEQFGRRVAVLAITTPQVPRWEEPRHIEGLEFRGAIPTVEEWLPRLKAEGADAIVVAAHMGWTGVTDGGFEVPEPRENDIENLVQAVTGMDAVLMGHTHQIVEPRYENGALVMQAGASGKAVGELRLGWDGDLVTATGRVAEVDSETEPCAKVLVAVASAEDHAELRVSEILGRATAPFEIENVRYGDNAVLSLLHRVQLEASSADLSTAALFREWEGLAAGDITVLDLFRIYPFENSLSVLELTVQDVRDYLEEIALAYLGPSTNGTPPPIHPQVSLYNHDAIAGCEYEIDPSREPGRRVTAFTFDGEERSPSDRVTMALTSYRAQGGGGYQALRRGKIVKESNREVRWLIGEFIQRHGVIEPTLFDNWSVIGSGQGAQKAPAPRARRG